MKNLFYPTLVIVSLIVLLFISCKKENTTIPPTGGGPTSVTAKEFLSSSNYDKLTIQIQFVNGLQPTQTAMDNLKSFLQQRLNKPNGIEIVYSSINSPGHSIYTIDDIRAVESTNRTIQANGKTISAYILFIDGDYSQNNGNLKTLGVAYSSSSMVVFEKTIRDLSGGLGQPSVSSVEASVSEHEFAHILGLVNNGTAMTIGHQDEPHGKHCNNSNCLMYYATETSDLIANLIGNNIPSLDNNCISDLKANGGK